VNTDSFERKMNLEIGITYIPVVRPFDVPPYGPGLDKSSASDPCTPPDFAPINTAIGLLLI
jgi:hypothetical protein